MTIALILCLLSSVYMLGVIWIIQLIHYPSFANVSPDQFLQFHAQHTMAMGYLVGPVMVIELVAGSWLLLNKIDFFSVTQFLMVVALWILTFFISVPLHNKLAVGFDLATIKALIHTNWPRTILWTLKALLTSFWAFRMIKI